MCFHFHRELNFEEPGIFMASVGIVWLIFVFQLDFSFETQHLVLSLANGIGNGGAKVLATALRENTSIQYMDLGMFLWSASRLESEKIRDMNSRDFMNMKHEFVRFIIYVMLHKAWARIGKTTESRFISIIFDLIMKIALHVIHLHLRRFQQNVHQLWKT